MAYTKNSAKIQEIVFSNTRSRKKVTWININNARKPEIEYLRKKFNFNLNLLQFSSEVHTSQRPIMENHGKYLFLIMHFPILDDKNIISGEIDFFICKNTVVTIHNNNIPAFNDFFSLCKKNPESSMANKKPLTNLLLNEIFAKILTASYGLLDQNSVDIEATESVIFAQKEKHAVSQILSLKRNIINIRKITQSHKNIFKKLMNSDFSDLNNEDSKQQYRILIENTKTFWETMENQREMIIALDKTNESLLNYKISDIMKTLTIFSVIVFPLTLLAALFGMNVSGGMPLLDNPNGFWIINSIMLLGSLSMLFYFERKKWL